MSLGVGLGRDRLALFCTCLGGMHMTSHDGSPAHQLCFASLLHQEASVVVPCDSHGEVDLNSLSDRLKNAYLGARALVGWAFDRPTVEEVP